MPTPIPTPIYRMIHIENLEVLLKRQKIHAPNQAPSEGFVYRSIHDSEVQVKRKAQTVAVGPGGVVHDYVPFYFGPRSPMLLRLHTGRVAGYTQGQDPLMYLVSSVQKIIASKARFVFTDGHSLASFTKWFTDPSDLEAIDWPTVNAT